MNKILLISFTMVLASAAQARSKIGSAGCGLGNMIFGTENQIVAATTNGSSYSQVSGITSGTSNCVDESGNAKLEGYIEANPVALATDMARGHGETLKGLTQVLNCSKPEEVHGLLKNNYKSIYKNGTYDTSYISREVREVLKTNQPIGEGCQG